MGALQCAILLVLCALGHGIDTSLSSSLTLDSGGRPVSKVVTLLKDMLKELENEAEEDEEIYDKMVCWCNLNDKEKTKAIKDGEDAIDVLITKIEEYTAAVSRLSTEIKHLKDDIFKYTSAFDQATSIREKERAEWDDEEKDMLETIAALKSAIIVLSKHEAASLAQAPPSWINLLSVKATLHKLLKHADALHGLLDPKQRSQVSSFLQEAAPASAEILGILKAMLEEFEKNLKDGQADEAAGANSYEELKVSSTTEIKQANTLLDKKLLELAEHEEKLAVWKIDLDGTRAKLAEDEKFLAFLKERCQKIDYEWEQRQKTRAQEMEAVRKAMAVLTSDDAHALAGRTVNRFLQVSMLQARSSSQKELRSKAFELLKSAAHKLNNPKLSVLALQVRLDAFTKVKKAIDDMIAELLKEKADEIKHKDFCVDEFNKNERQTQKKNHEKTDTMAKIEDLKMTIEQLTGEIKALKMEIDEMKLQIKRAGEDREKANNEFQVVVADQRAAQKLLKQALDVLKTFYEKGAALVQAPVNALGGPAPPPGFSDYNTNAAAPGVMGMLDQIVNDAKAMELAAIRDESKDQKEYEDMVMETNASIEQAKKEIIHKSEAKAKAEADLASAEENLANVELELEQLANMNEQLHKSCDFILKNFDIRQQAREEEIEALKEAKAILSGAKFSAFLQQS